MIEAAELYGITLTGTVTGAGTGTGTGAGAGTVVGTRIGTARTGVLHCIVNRAKLDEFKATLLGALPHLTPAQVDNAAMIYYALRQHPQVRFTYRKDDGSIRKATGTLMNDCLPPAGAKRTGASWGASDNITSRKYYDLGSSGWRRFRYEALLSIDSRVRLTVI